MGKVIYQPKGKAREYSTWACNLYVGCSNDCSYCFNKRGVLGTVMGGKEPKLKSCIKDSFEAYSTFLGEVQRYRDEIVRDGGLLFSFSTDPCLPETVDLTMMCISTATGMQIPCQILTKCTDWILNDKVTAQTLLLSRDLLSVGFTLTGADELEPGASPNSRRVEALRFLHDRGFHTFASIEPVITFKDSLDMIRSAEPGCELFKVGLLSGDRDAYAGCTMPDDLETFVKEVNTFLTKKGKPVYWKRSVSKALGRPVEGACCVGADYDILNLSKTTQQ